MRQRQPLHWQVPLREAGLTTKTSIRLETASGIKVLNLHLNTDDSRRVDSVTVDMLEPRLDVAEQYDGTRTDGTLRLDG